MAYFLQSDAEVFESIQREFVRQNEHLEMIASENYTFPSVMEACGSVLTNKYAEGYPGKRYYGGCEFVDEVEKIAVERAKRLFGCNFANVQPHSGSQANFAVYSALLESGDKILGLDLAHGGHLTHGSRVNASGKFFESHFYGVNEEGLIDYDALESSALKIAPKLIVCGFSAYSRELDFVRFREIADKVGALLMADIAHVAGLVVAGEYPNPFPHAHVVTSTTHKTLRGPRGGIILSNDEELAKKIDKAIFPGIQGGPLMHIIAAKAVGFGENLKPEWKDYARAIKRNIKALERTFNERGVNMVSGGSDNHLLLLDFLDKDYSGKDVEKILGECNITANKNTVPGEKRSPFITSGIRLGSAALTARGLAEADFIEIGNLIADVLENMSDKEARLAIKERVNKLSERYPVYDRAIF